MTRSCTMASRFRAECTQLQRMFHACAGASAQHAPILHVHACVLVHVHTHTCTLICAHMEELAGTLTLLLTHMHTHARVHACTLAGAGRTGGAN